MMAKYLRGLALAAPIVLFSTDWDDIRKWDSTRLSRQAQESAWSLSKCSTIAIDTQSPRK